MLILRHPFCYTHFASHRPLSSYPEPPLLIFLSTPSFPLTHLAHFISPRPQRKLSPHFLVVFFHSMSFLRATFSPDSVSSGCTSTHFISPRHASLLDAAPPQPQHCNTTRSSRPLLLLKGLTGGLGDTREENMRRGFC